MNSLRKSLPMRSREFLRSGVQGYYDLRKILGQSRSFFFPLSREFPYGLLTRNLCGRGPRSAPSGRKSRRICRISDARFMLKA